MAKELALAARQALPKVQRLGLAALMELVSSILTPQLLDDIANARALVYFGQSSRVEAELNREYFKFFTACRGPPVIAWRHVQPAAATTGGGAGRHEGTHDPIQGEKRGHQWPAGEGAAACCDDPVPLA